MGPIAHCYCSPIRATGSRRIARSRRYCDTTGGSSSGPRSESELRKQIEAGLLTSEVARDRLAALGPEVELEARFVLEADHVVPRGADDLTVYVAFVATFAEYARFDPHGLRWVFPSCPTPAQGLAAVAGGIAFDRLLARTRPAGAADAVPLTVADAHARPGPGRAGPGRQRGVAGAVAAGGGDRQPRPRGDPADPSGRVGVGADPVRAGAAARGAFWVGTSRPRGPGGVPWGRC